MAKTADKPEPTTLATFRCSRGSRPFANAPACTSVRRPRAGCTTSCTRSSTTPSTRRSPATPTSVDVVHPRRRLDHGRRQRPRHSGRHSPDGEDPRRRAGDDRAARRRQVRQGQLQGLRRSARRRRVRRERAVRAAQGVGEARRQGVLHGLRARRRPPRSSRCSARLAHARRGTKVWFKPDDKIFTELAVRLRDAGARACASCRSSTRA